MKSVHKMATWYGTSQSVEKIMIFALGDNCDDDTLDAAMQLMSRFKELGSIPSREAFHWALALRPRPQVGLMLMLWFAEVDEKDLDGLYRYFMDEFGWSRKKIEEAAKGSRIQRDGEALGWNAGAGVHVISERQARSMRKVAVSIYYNHRWEQSKQRYYDLAQAHAALGRTGHWTDAYPEKYGPSKEWGVKYEKPSWRAYITTCDGQLHLGTYADEAYAGRVVDVARVYLRLEPKNDLALWKQMVAWEAKPEGAMPFEPARAALPGAVTAVRVDTVSVLADKTSPVEVEIAAAVAAKPSIPVGTFLNRSGLGYTAKNAALFKDLAAAGICTVGDLACANVNCDALIAIFGSCTSVHATAAARKRLGEWKRAAAALFDVKFDLPRKQSKEYKPKSLAARQAGKPQEQKNVLEAVAEWEAHAVNYDQAYAKRQAPALLAIAQQRHADEPMPAAGGEEP